VIRDDGKQRYVRMLKLVRFLSGVGDILKSLVIPKVVGVEFQRSFAKYLACLKYCILE